MPRPKPRHPFDLHVLGMPPAFVLSQDQTLKFIPRVLPDRKPKSKGHQTLTCVRAQQPTAAARASLPSSLLNQHPGNQGHSLAPGRAALITPSPRPVNHLAQMIAKNRKPEAARQNFTPQRPHGEGLT